MDSMQRIKNLKDANWGPPLGGSFAQLAADLHLTIEEIVASGEPADEYYEDDTVLIEDGTS